MTNLQSSTQRNQASSEGAITSKDGFVHYVAVTCSRSIRLSIALLVLCIAAVIAPQFSVNAQNNTATLSISSVPTGAKAFLNEKAVGVTPVNLNLKAGHYGVILRKDGCRDFAVSLTLNAGERKQINAQLSCNSGNVPQAPRPAQPQDPTRQLAGQGQVIGPTHPQFGGLATEFYATLGLDSPTIAAKLQSLPIGAGEKSAVFPELQQLNLTQVLQGQKQAILLGRFALPTAASFGGVQLPAGHYGVAIMNDGAAPALDGTSNAFHIGFSIVLINLYTGNVVAFLYFPASLFWLFLFFFPMGWTPWFIFQLIFVFIFP